ncbi:MAG: tRNA adenosine(34) deaminase TadA [Defluviitaleaceae bacterium]|nr:tRNA adenosine(34) deaminase TadA [Defluviitaleaceae bacterium]
MGDKCQHEHFMQKAIKLAKQAADAMEVPVGCVIVHNGEIIGEGYNQRNTKGNTLYHAEISAINTACNHLGDWRLEGCTIYVTLEPCPMCAGAILQARLPRLVFGAANPKAGAVGSVVNLLDVDGFNHKVDVTTGVLEAQCAQLMKDFFAKFRRKSGDGCGNL